MPCRGGSAPRGKAGKRARRSGWKARAGRGPEKAKARGDEIEKPKARRRPEWQAVREAGAERQTAALAGLQAARAAAALRGIEISVSMISLSRRGKATVAHVRFLKDAEVIAHFHPAVGRLFFGRKGKIGDEGRYETVEEAAARVIAYDDEAAEDRAADASATDL
jgi:hypothetical protein